MYLTEQVYKMLWGFYLSYMTPRVEPLLLNLSKHQNQRITAVLINGMYLKGKDFGSGQGYAVNTVPSEFFKEYSLLSDELNKAEQDLKRIQQMINLISSKSCSTCEFRDSLPDSIRNLITKLPREYQPGHCFRDNELHLTQFNKLIPLMDYYATLRLLGG